MTFAYVQYSYPDDPAQKLLAGQALFLEMMNLQLLAMQHMVVSEESFEAATSIRIGFLRNYARLYFEEKYSKLSVTVPNDKRCRYIRKYR